MSCSTAAASDDTAVAEQERKASAAAVVTHGGGATAAARCHIAQQGAAVAESTEGHPSAAAASSADAAVPPNWLTSLMSMNGLQLDPAVLQLIAASGITPDEFAGLTYEALKRRFPSLCINNRLMTMRLVNAAADARALDRILALVSGLTWFEQMDDEQMAALHRVLDVAHAPTEEARVAAMAVLEKHAPRTQSKTAPEVDRLGA